MSKAEKSEPNQPLIPPKGADPQWQEKIETSLRAREFSKQMRQGKASSFRRTVGRAE